MTSTATVIICGNDVFIEQHAFVGNDNLLFKVKKGSAVEAFLQNKKYKIEYLPEE